jgi:hypothetical protein
VEIAKTDPQIGMDLDAYCRKILISPGMMNFASHPGKKNVIAG